MSKRRLKLPEPPEKATLVYRKMPDRVDVTDAQIAEAIEHARGNLAMVARRLGVNRQFVARRVDGNEVLGSLLHDVREGRLDNVEDSVYQQALAGDTRASIFILRTLGKKRGYDIGNSGVTFNLTNIDLSKLPTEQLKRLASGEDPDVVLGEYEIVDSPAS